MSASPPTPLSAGPDHQQRLRFTFSTTAAMAVANVFDSSPSSPAIDASAAVEAQAEAAHAFGGSNIFAALRAANLDAVTCLLNKQPDLIDSRGPVGETLLHLAYLHNTPKHKEIARLLLHRKPSLISATYTGLPYFGENLLHMAIANGDEAAVRFLMGRCRALLFGRATGSFFRPDGPAYMGEFPLSFAAVTNQPALVRYLVEECDALIDARDTHGNTVAHLCVIHKRLEMLDLICGLWDRGYGRPDWMRGVPLSTLCNRDGYSILVLAASLGDADTFMHVWNKSAEVEWKWGPITAMLYPLVGVDDIAAVLEREAGRLEVEKFNEKKRMRRLKGAAPPTPHGTSSGSSRGSSSGGGSASAVNGGAPATLTPPPPPSAVTIAAMQPPAMSLSASFSPPVINSHSPAPTTSAGSATHPTKKIVPINKRKLLAQYVTRAAALEKQRLHAESEYLSANAIEKVAPVSVLQLLATSEHCETILLLPRMMELQQKKWDRFAYGRFRGRLVSTIAFLLLYSFVLVLRSHTLGAGVVDKASSCAATGRSDILGARVVGASSCTTTDQSAVSPSNASGNYPHHESCSVIGDMRNDCADASGISQTVADAVFGERSTSGSATSTADTNGADNDDEDDNVLNSGWLWRWSAPLCRPISNSQRQLSTSTLENSCSLPVDNQKQQQRQSPPSGGLFTTATSTLSAFAAPPSICAIATLGEAVLLGLALTRVRAGAKRLLFRGGWHGPTRTRSGLSGSLHALFSAFATGVRSTRGAGMLESVLSLASASTIAVAITSDIVAGSAGAGYARSLHAIASIVSWLSALWFCLGFRLTGPFIIVLYSIVADDLRRFMALIVIVLMGFGQAFFVLAGKRGAGLTGLFSELRRAFGTMLSPELAVDNSSTGLQVTTAMFIVLATVVLLNLLVAMMGQTFGRVIEAADRQWLLERGRIVLAIEQEMSDLERSAAKYWAMAHDEPCLLVEDKDDSVFTSASQRQAVLEGIEAVAQLPGTTDREKIVKLRRRMRDISRQ